MKHFYSIQFSSSRPSYTGILSIIVIIIHLPVISESKTRVGEINVTLYREKVKNMFYHAYEGYLKYAYPYDELQPLTCGGHDTWGSYSLTLIDAMDTLAVMGNYSEFRRIAQILIDKGESFFDIDINASVFETNIRIVGGLLSGHLLMKRAGMVLEPAWPCSGPLLRMADNIARKILPAFDTPTGMPYGTVNLRHGVPKGETTVTCTAGVGTFIVEFGTLSRLTGDPIFEKAAIRAIRSLWKYRSSLGLLGNHIDVSNGKWTALDSGIGGGIDSYFEYLVKGAVMFNIPELLHMFREYEEPIKKYIKRDDWYMWAQMNKGSITLPLFTSLDGFWPGIQAILGDIEDGMKTIHNFHQVWRQYGFTPEYYNIPKADVHQGREGYPLRPEIIESVMYLYQATKDPYLLEMGVDIVESIEHSARTACGYATIKDVRDHRLEDRMESFFLAETTKYLYLLFDPDNFIHNNGSRGDVVHTPSGSCVIEAGGYVFNTEAHPIDLAAVHCCSAFKKEEERVLQEFHDNLDLLSLFSLVETKEPTNWLSANKRFKKKTAKRVAGVGKEDEVEGSEHVDVVKVNEDEDVKEDSPDDDDDDFKSFEDMDTDFKSWRDKDSVDSHKHKSDGKRSLEVIDMTSFTEKERNLTHIFLKEMQIQNILKNLSVQIAEKLRQQYKDSEYENLANNAAKKILEAGDNLPVVETVQNSTNVPETAPATNVPEPAPATNVPEPAPATNVPEPAPATNVPEPAPATNVPEPAPGTNVPEPAPATNVPEPAPATNVPEPAPGTNVPEPAPATNVPEPAPGTNVPEPAPATNVPEPSPGTNVPEPAPATNVPEPAPGTNVPEPSPATNVPETAPGTNVPETAPGTNVPETAPGTNVPETAPGTNVPETVPATNVPETAPASNVIDQVSHPVASQGELSGDTSHPEASHHEEEQKDNQAMIVEEKVVSSDGERKTVIQHKITLRGEESVVIIKMGKESDGKEFDGKESDGDSSTKMETGQGEVTPQQSTEETVRSPNPTTEKFKSHIEHQIQTQSTQQDPASPVMAPDTPPSPLEVKRDNILSITRKILNLFSSTTEETEQESKAPSLSGLYTSLSNYTLNYFHDPTILHCPAQTFHSRVSVYGEMFQDD
ncbi:uncharacterized protein LOC131952295 [Physella acuta]|uniref:uncharacterized protein LOC131952295 n=1 Tax=Physella acuta TaxID=109671 RepID=UPI0027DB541F|nr:uncharacterized protein LOC131952295 [Physella acuta]